MRGCFDGAVGNHPSSWVQNNLFAEWFIEFIEKTNPTEMKDQFHSLLMVTKTTFAILM